MGLPVIVNRAAIEGMVGFDNYDLIFDENDLAEFLCGDIKTIRGRLNAVRQTSINLARQYWSKQILENFIDRHFVLGRS